MLAIIEYFIFGFMVGAARGKYGVSAPAVTGDPIFERYYRVQQNTLEQLAGLLPAITVYGFYGNPQVAAGLGLVFIISRAVYAYTYINDPAKRAWGFVPGWLATVLMIVLGLWSAYGAL
jgi:uncharacterized membrane protein YecN with MAPEG domain